MHSLYLSHEFLRCWYTQNLYALHHAFWQRRLDILCLQVRWGLCGVKNKHSFSCTSHFFGNGNKCQPGSQCVLILPAMLLCIVVLLIEARLPCLLRAILKEVIRPATKAVIFAKSQTLAPQIFQVDRLARLC